MVRRDYGPAGACRRKASWFLMVTLMAAAVLLQLTVRVLRRVAHGRHLRR